MAEAIYSVWALPQEAVSERVKRVMKALRKEFGGPEFEPHITIVGATRLTHEAALRNLHAASAIVGPYTARSTAVSRGNSFFQCVYLLVDPSPEVVAVRSSCCELFGVEGGGYMPHLSLLYGELSEEERRRAAAMAETIDGELVGSDFSIAALALYKTDTSDKTLESWEKVAVCDLIV
ncbi:cyclic phosphodiesterase-like [Wolffia australiana]